SLQLQKQVTHAIDGANNVRPRLPENYEQNRRLPIREPCILRVLYRIPNISHFAQKNGSAASGGDDQILIFTCFEYLIIGIDHPGVLNAADLPFGGMRVRRADGRSHSFETDI